MYYVNELFNEVPLFGLGRLPLLSKYQYHALHFHILRFRFLQLRVPKIHVLSFDPSSTCPAISRRTNWSVNFTSCMFMSVIFTATYCSVALYQDRHQCERCCQTVMRNLSDCISKSSLFTIRNLTNINILLTTPLRL